jgi:hypothetical protein
VNSSAGGVGEAGHPQQAAVAVDVGDIAALRDRRAAVRCFMLVSFGG